MNESDCFVCTKQATRSVECWFFCCFFCFRVIEAEQRGEDGHAQAGGADSPKKAGRPQASRFGFFLTQLAPHSLSQSVSHSLSRWGWCHLFRGDSVSETTATRSVAFALLTADQIRSRDDDDDE